MGINTHVYTVYGVRLDWEWYHESLKEGGYFDEEEE